MIKFLLAALLIPQLAFAGLPPTTSKVVGDSSNITTFNFQFPNFAATRSGATTTFGLMNVSGLSTGTAGQVLGVSGGVPAWVNGAGVSVGPTVQKFLSGSGTYTPPSGPAPTSIRVRGCGGGGAGGPGGNTQLTANSGANTTFGTITANGGTAGAGGGNGGTGGRGGTTSIGALGGSDFTGGDGQGSGNTATGAQGGQGGSSMFGGNGGGSQNFGGNSPTAGKRCGGGGGGPGVSTTAQGGAGGGAGGGFEVWIPGIPTTYSYSVGAGGSGAVGQYPGGDGGAGYLEITEFYGYSYVTSGSSTTQPGVTITASTTANAAQLNFFCNATSGNVVVTLPLISSLGSSNAAHQQFCLKKIDASANTCSFAAASGDTIDGATTNSISAQYTIRCIIDNAGTAWYVH